MRKNLFNLGHMALSVSMLATVSTFSSIASSSDPLISRLSGQWAGDGQRIFPIVGRRVLLSSRVSTQLQPDGRLLIRDHRTERSVSPIADPTEPRESVRLFWIRPKPDSVAPAAGPQLYELGYGSGEADLRPSAEGVYEDNLLRVVKNQNSGSATRTESETEFNSPDNFDLVERVWQGDEIKVETRLHYHRVRGG